MIHCPYSKFGEFFKTNFKTVHGSLGYREEELCHPFDSLFVGLWVQAVATRILRALESLLGSFQYLTSQIIEK